MSGQFLTFGLVANAFVALLLLSQHPLVPQGSLTGVATVICVDRFLSRKLPKEKEQIETVHATLRSALPAIFAIWYDARAR